MQYLVGVRVFSPYGRSTRFPFLHDKNHSEIWENDLEPSGRNFSLTARDWWFRRRNITNLSSILHAKCADTKRILPLHGRYTPTVFLRCGNAEKHRRGLRILHRSTQVLLRGHKYKTSAFKRMFCICAPGRIRTSDRLVKSELLYQLSYEGMCFDSLCFLSLSTFFCYLPR